jgi:hypothetical protein
MLGYRSPLGIITGFPRISSVHEPPFQMRPNLLNLLEALRVGLNADVVQLFGIVRMYTA